METKSREINLLTYFVVFLTFYHVIARFGLAVDLQWHTDVGRDKLLTPPHLMIFSGIIPTMIFLVCYIVWHSFVKTKPKSGMQVWIFSAPIPIWIILSGMITLILGGLYDDLWHSSYGVDTTIITPPHIWTFAGGMIVELATIILALQIKQLTQSNHQLLNISMLFTMWALVYHLHLAFANFLDPRVWVIEIIGIEIILHFIFAGSALLIMLPIMRSISGDEGIISLAGLMLASQLLFILLVPKLVDLMMGTEHVYRPGSPNTVWAAQCLPWLLFLGVLIIKKYSSFDNPTSMISLVIIVDAAWLPTFIQHIPSEVGVVNTVISVIISVVILRFIWLLNPKIMMAIQRLSQEYSSKENSKSKLPKSLVTIVLLSLLLPSVSAHSIHFVEEGEGFDAPKRFLIDVDDEYLWVEFMIWPPKATTEASIVIYSHDNESTEIDNVWVELIQESDKGDVTMITELDNPGDYQLWQGSVLFPFSGNQTLQIWSEVDGNQSYTEIPVIVDSPALLPVWLAWVVGIAWPSALVVFWWRVSLRID